MCLTIFVVNNNELKVTDIRAGLSIINDTSHFQLLTNRSYFTLSYGVVCDVCDRDCLM